MSKLTAADTFPADDRESIAIEADDELLVAYLDGELPRDERAEVEQRLLDDEDFRKRLQLLQRTWDLLGVLPTPIPDEKGVQTTLELVVADLTGHPAGNATPTATSTESVKTRRPIPQTARFLFALAVTAAIVFAVTRALQTRFFSRQVADFPVAMDQDAYSLAGDASLLEDLRSMTRWRNVIAPSPLPDVEALIDPTSPESIYPGEQTPGNLSVLTKRLDQIPEQQKTLAATRWSRFDQLDQDTKTQLRTQAKRIRESERASETLSLLRDYARWREQLDPETVRQIESQSGTERMSAIAAAIEESVRSIGRTTRRSLSMETIERLDYAMVRITKDRIENEGESASRMLRFMQQRTRDIGDPDAPYRAFGLIMLRGDRPPIGKAPVTVFRPLSPTELDTIENMLTAADVETLHRYDTDPWMRSMILREWVEESLRRKLLGELQPSSMIEQYRDLAPSQREWIDLSSPEEARKRLLEAKVDHDGSSGTPPWRDSRNTPTPPVKLPK